MKTMRKKSVVWTVILILLASAAEAQQHNSVQLGHEAYTIIEMGVMRGAITPPVSVRPWSESIIRQKLSEMLDDTTGKFSDNEQRIINAALKSFNRKNGLSLIDGRYYGENAIGRHKFTIDAGIKWDSNFSARIPEPAIATVNRGTLFAAGDMGEFLSWNFNIGGGFLIVERTELGLRPDPLYVDPKYGAYDGNPNSRGHIYAYDIPNPSSSMVYSIPAYFPYTFTKTFEAGVFPPDNIGGYVPWPDKFSFFYEMLGEINASFFENHLFLRFARIRRDWGPEENGSSLFLNASARPFMAFEGTAIPLNWLKLSFLTGVPEYLNKGNQWSDANSFQNFIAMGLLEIDTGRHFHLDFGSVAVFPKRFELGYSFPLSSNFFYQNNLGDFDNLAMYANMEFRFSRLKIWGSLYVDEIRPVLGSFLNLNRNMYAYQGGVKTNIRWLPFGALTLRYTKIEPYCYTHEYTETPWHKVPIDTAYINNGECLGSYLPPNSDEFLVRMEAMPIQGLRANIQYQLIRHGVDWGYRRIPGSSIWDKITKDENSEKFFLRDGVYQWNHVIKLGGIYSLKTLNIPVSFYADTGIIITRFTNSDAEIGKKGNFSAIDNAVYRAGNYWLLSLGFKIFP